VLRSCALQETGRTGSRWPVALTGARRGEGPTRSNRSCPMKLCARPSAGPRRSSTATAPRARGATWGRRPGRPAAACRRRSDQRRSCRPQPGTFWQWGGGPVVRVPQLDPAPGWLSCRRRTRWRPCSPRSPVSAAVCRRHHAPRPGEPVHRRPAGADRLSDLPDEAILAELTAIPGVGLWPVQGALLLALPHEDVVLPGDHALARSVLATYGLDHRPDQNEILAIPERWRPCCSLTQLSALRPVPTLCEGTGRPGRYNPAGITRPPCNQPSDESRSRQACSQRRQISSHTRQCSWCSAWRWHSSPHARQVVAHASRTLRVTFASSSV
jgi:hypothetical protein